MSHQRLSHPAVRKSLAGGIILHVYGSRKNASLSMLALAFSRQPTLFLKRCNELATLRLT